MENKFNKKQNILITSVLVALCVVILIATYFLLKEPENTFEPAPENMETTTETWTDNTEPDMTSDTFTTPNNSVVTGSESDDTQTIIYEDETNVITSLSGETKPDSSNSEKPTESPVTTDDTSNPEKAPVYDASVPQTETQETEPAPSESRPGQVYDPVFGWIDAGSTSQDTVDSGGDINKQIGDM